MFRPPFEGLGFVRQRIPRGIGDPAEAVLDDWEADCIPPFAVIAAEIAGVHPELPADAAPAAWATGAALPPATQQTLEIMLKASFARGATWQRERLGK